MIHTSHPFATTTPPSNLCYGDPSTDTPAARRSTRLVASTLGGLILGLIFGLLLGAPAHAAEELSENAVATMSESVAPDVIFYNEQDFRDHLEAEGLIGADPPLIVPAAAFIGDGNTPNTFFPFSGGYIEGSPSDCVVAPIYLPDGTTIVNLFGYLYDDAVGDITLNLWRKRNDAVGSPTAMASTSTTGTSTSVQITGDSTVDNPVVDNDFYSYYLTTCLNSSEHHLNAAWIFFNPPVAPIEASFLNVFSNSGGTQVLVEENSGTIARRQLFRLENNGPPEFSLVDNDRGLTWKFGTRGNHFEINRGNSGQTEMLLRANGDLEITGTLSQGSSRTLKQNFETVDSRDILDRVAELPLLEWSYKTAEGERHFGPMAEDFHAAFGFGHDPARLAPGDAAGVALAAVQGLNGRMDERLLERDREIESLRAEVEELRELVRQIAR